MATKKAKKVVSKKPSKKAVVAPFTPKPGRLNPAVISIGMWTIFTVLFYWFFTVFYLPSRTGFSFYVPSKLGGNFEYLDPLVASNNILIFIGVSGLAALLAYLLGKAKRFPAQGLLTVVYFAAIYIFTMLYVGNVVENMYNNTMSTIFSLILVTSLAAFIEFYYFRRVTIAGSRKK